MRRFAFIACLLAALAGGGMAAVAQTQQQPSEKPPLEVKLQTCQTGATPSDRYAVFTGSMPRQPKTASMAMRFDLYERTPQSTEFGHVALPKWGIWERTTKAGVPGFIFTKRIDQLAAPATYRAVVSFRWYDAKGKLLRSARRVSPNCHQPDPRPDLHVKRVYFDGGKMHVVVRNRGRGVAGAVDVRATGPRGPRASRAASRPPPAPPTPGPLPARPRPP